MNQNNENPYVRGNFFWDEMTRAVKFIPWHYGKFYIDEGKVKCVCCDPYFQTMEVDYEDSADKKQDFNWSWTNNPNIGAGYEIFKVNIIPGEDQYERLKSLDKLTMTSIAAIHNFKKEYPSLPYTVMP